MRIGIDARLIEETGVGRYIQNLISELGRIDTTHEYVVFLRKKSFDTFVLPHTRWHKVLADVPWHSLREQLVMPGIFLKEELDLLHVPYFNVPIFYPRKLIVTIHDLTILHFYTGRATTLPLLLYKIKRLGYWVELAIGLRKAKKIIAVSETTKLEIIDHFGIESDKILVTYEAADDKLVDLSKKAGKPLVSDPYILYVGNAYPHKNLDRLLEAWQGKLVLATPDDFFSKRLKTAEKVLMFRGASVSELANLYKYAQVLVFPSLMEGFGLPGIEAMAIGTPVACSNIPVFSEIYGDACLVFNPNDSNDIAQKLNNVLQNEKLRKELIAKGKKKAVHYSWRRMAEQTLSVYKEAVSP